MMFFMNCKLECIGMTAVVVDVIVKDEIDGEVVSRCRFFQKKKEKLSFMNVTYH